jgi:hypothetical protein
LILELFQLIATKLYVEDFQKYNGIMALHDAESVEVSIKNFKRFEEIPLHVLDKLPFSVYIIDYNWIYLFLNANSINVFGSLANSLIGKSALEVFKDARYQAMFDKIKEGVENKISLNTTVYSPLRGRQVNIKGYPLEDCYYFSATILPAKEEVLADLRAQLKRKK